MSIIMLHINLQECTYKTVHKDTQGMDKDGCIICQRRQAKSRISHHVPNTMKKSCNCLIWVCHSQTGGIEYLGKAVTSTSTRIMHQIQALTSKTDTPHVWCTSCTNSKHKMKKSDFLSQVQQYLGQLNPYKGVITDRPGHKTL